MLKNYVDSPLFYDGAEMSATDLNILRGNAKLLEGLSKRPGPMFAIDTGITGHNLNEFIWRGGFQYRVGLTTATIVLFAVVTGSPPVTAQFKIYFNGVEMHTRNLATEAVTINITINDKGYTDYQVITVECMLVGTGYDPTPDTFFINGAYTSPLSGVMTTSYPGTTTFGTVDATKLNNLANSLDWLAERLALVPYVPFMALRNWQGTFYVQEVFLWRGKIYLEALNRRLYIDMDFTSRSPETYIKVVVNGVSFVYGPYATNITTSIAVDIDIITDAGCTIGNEYHVDIRENLTVESPNEPKYNSRLNIKSVRMGSAAYTLIVPPPESQMLESITYETLRSRLNIVKAIADAIKTRIDSNAYLFDTAIMSRSRYGNSWFHHEYWQDEHVIRNKRLADVLWVKGQGLSIGYGAVTVTTKGDNEKYEYHYQYSESLTAGDKIETKFFYLDQFEALYPGMEYFIYGKDIIFVAEYLR